MSTESIGAAGLAGVDWRRADSLPAFPGFITLGTGLADAGTGPFGFLSVGFSIGLQLVVMVFAAGLAALGPRRGWSAVAVVHDRRPGRAG